jgi:peptide/nickel transport system permease protein
MLRYITRRLMWAAALLVIVTAVVFVMFNVLPTGDPAALRAGRNASPEQIENIRESLGLDDPIYERFGRYMLGVFTPYSNDEANIDCRFARSSSTACRRRSSSSPARS